MAEPTESYPESATNAARNAAENGDGEAAVDAALASNGAELAALIERTDELEQITDSTANLVEAADGLTTDEATELATMLGENAEEMGEVLDTVVRLQREGHLEDIVELARMGSALDLDEDAVSGLNAVLGAVGEAERSSEPVGPLGAVWQLRGRDARAGLGYVVALLKGVGRRRRGR